MPQRSKEGSENVPVTRILNAHFDVSIRPAERLGSNWESCGDIVERVSGKLRARVYGSGPTSAAAELEAEREAERWVYRNPVVR
jgi:hypothetical protein